MAKQTFYLDNLKGSTETVFYRSGNLKSRQYWSKGVAWGEYTLYYDGLFDEYYTLEGGDTIKVKEPMMKKYIVFDKSEKNAYSREYDQSGNLLSQKGSPIIMQRYNSLDLLTSDTLIVQYYLAAPKWVDRHFELCVFKDDSLIEKTKMEINDEYDAVFYDRQFIQAGMYRIGGISKFVDQLNNKVKTDTIWNEVYIRESFRKI